MSPALRRGSAVFLTTLGTATAYRYQNVKQRESQLPANRLNVFAKPKEGQKQVVIIGAGVVGVSTAYKLAKLGHQVVVLVRMFPDQLYHSYTSKDPTKFTYARSQPQSQAKNAANAPLVECPVKMS
jgi:NADH dehydrogenase FAD-containing subunit